MTTPAGPFDALGLPPSADLTDQQVRDAWRATATATHPDRPDGGDPARYAAASTAYQELRTPFGRGEALADLRDAAPASYGPLPPPAARPAPVTLTPAAAARAFPWRLRHGRPARIAARALIAAAAAWGAVAYTAGTPAEPAIVYGCALWFVLSSRHDLAPPPGR
jgi:curved DNA-binding protein CbpA